MERSVLKMDSNLRVNNTTKDSILIAMAAVLIVICSWISIPLTVPVTLQTFAIFAVVGLLGLKRGTFAVMLYILLGTIGLPVFSGFRGGVGILLGNTGGYIVGFIFSALVAGLITKYFGRKKAVLVISMIAGLLVCYIFGTAWFINVYTNNTGEVGLITALSWCVFPFIIPDAVKIGLAVIVVDRVAKYARY
jgi:biotin transport system substrate-specific component